MTSLLVSPDPLPGLDTEPLAECLEFAARAVRRHDLDMFERWMTEAGLKLHAMGEAIPKPKRRARLRLVKP